MPDSSSTTSHPHLEELADQLSDTVASQVARRSRELTGKLPDGWSREDGSLAVFARQAADVKEAVKELLLDLVHDNDALASSVMQDLSAFLGRYYDSGDFTAFPLSSTSTPYYAAWQSPAGASGAVHPSGMHAHRGEDTSFTWRGRGSHYVHTASLDTVAYRHAESGVLVTVVVDRAGAGAADEGLLPIPQIKVLPGGQEIHIRVGFRPLDPSDPTPALNKDGSFKKGKRAVFLQECLTPPMNALPEADPVVASLGVLVDEALLATSEMFLHPKLGEFLAAELHRYVIENLLGGARLADLDASRERVSRLVEVGSAVVAAIGAVEESLARRFQQPRPVSGEYWLLPVRLLGDASVAAALASDAQRSEWADLYRQDVEADEDPAALRERLPTLLVDTKLLSPAEAAGALEDARRSCGADALDDITDATLIKGENYGALRTFEAQLRGSVDVVITDPPYGTGNDGFAYKDDFRRDSTWLTFMEERLRLAARTLADGGWLAVSIDEHQHHNLRMLLRQIAASGDVTAEIVRKNRPGSDTGLSLDHEYLLLLGRRGASMRGEWKTPGTKYVHDDNDGRGVWRDADATAASSTWRQDTAFYPVFDHGAHIAYPANPRRAWAYSQACEWCGDETEDCANVRNKINGTPCMLHRERTNRLLVPTYDAALLEEFRAGVPNVYPRAAARLQEAGARPGQFIVVDAPVEDHKRWFTSGVVLVEADGVLYEVPQTDLDPARAGDRTKHEVGKVAIQRKSYFAELGATFNAVPSIWSDTSGFAVSNDVGTKRLRAILEEHRSEGTTPKPAGLIDRFVRYAEPAAPVVDDPNSPLGRSEDARRGSRTHVLDLFAGSGTVADAVFGLVRDDGRRRTVTLIEGNDFHKTLLPRVARVAFCQDWKDAAPQLPGERKQAEHAERSPRAIRVVELVDFHDTLPSRENVEAPDPLNPAHLRAGFEAGEHPPLPLPATTWQVVSGGRLRRQSHHQFPERSYVSVEIHFPGGDQLVVTASGEASDEDLRSILRSEAGLLDTPSVEQLASRWPRGVLTNFDSTVPGTSHLESRLGEALQRTEAGR